MGWNNPKSDISFEDLQGVINDLKKYSGVEKYLTRKERKELLVEMLKTKIPEFKDA